MKANEAGLAVPVFGVEGRDFLNLSGNLHVIPFTTGTTFRDLLTSRRDRLTPQQAGLPDCGGRRCVQGLGREEVALLAGMSTEYDVRLNAVATNRFGAALSS